MRPAAKKGIIGSAGIWLVFCSVRGRRGGFERTHLAVKLLGETESRHFDGKDVLERGVVEGFGR